MNSLGGHPTAPTVDSVDPVVMAAARQVLDDLAGSRRALRAAPAGPLRRAVLAARLAEAFDVLSCGAVTEARDGDAPVTWAEIGEAFRIKAQSAQQRFGRDRSQSGT